MLHYFIPGEGVVVKQDADSNLHSKAVLIVHTDPSGRPSIIKDRR